MNARRRTRSRAVARRRSGCAPAADRTVVELTSEARKQAEVIRGEADAERNAIYAEAFGRDPEFFAFTRSLTSYERALQGEQFVDRDAAGQRVLRLSAQRQGPAPGAIRSPAMSLVLLALGWCWWWRGWRLRWPLRAWRQLLALIARLSATSAACWGWRRWRWAWC